MDPPSPTQAAITPSTSSSSTSTAAGGGGGLRICETSDLEDNFRFSGSNEVVESLLSKIDDIYDRAMVMAAGGASGSSLNGDGRCFYSLGLLDPVTNLRFNRLLFATASTAADDDDDEEEDAMMAQRSLVISGLITFLTCLFPYLPDGEALAYLDAAAADPLVAALLVIDSRALTVDSFITAASVEIALRSAAAAASHPHPDAFIRAWKLASSSSLISSSSQQNLVATTHSSKEDWSFNDDDLLLLLRGTAALSTDDDHLELQLEDSWKLARDRLMSLIGTATLTEAARQQQLPSARGAKKRVLLSMIHQHYLKALAILPKQELTERYHRSLLIGGHCYGPLDPVSNIIVNTIWYEQSFPSAIQVQTPVHMISTECLWRVAARSLYGLVAFLCNREKDLSPDQALQRLLDARANLTLAAGPEQLRDHEDGNKTGRRGTAVLEAYVAAARSAKHPKADLQAEFLGAPKAVDNLIIQILSSETLLVLSVRHGCALTKESFDCLVALFRCSFPQHDEQHPKQLSRGVYLDTCTARNNFSLKQERVRSKVEAALHKFNENTVHKYNLHVICGVNEFVKREFSLDPEVRDYNPWTPYKYHYYSHINFLATCEGSLAPKLFFAECSNHGTSTPWCVPVPYSHCIQMLASI